MAKNKFSIPLMLLLATISIVSCQKSSTKPQPVQTNTVVTDPVTTSTATNTGQSPPNITYTYPQFFTVNMPITALAPNNTGTAVPATVYSQVSTIAGSSVYGLADGPGLSASFATPGGIVIDLSGDLFVTDLGNSIREVSAAGTVSTLVGIGNNSAELPGSVGLATDQSGNFYISFGHGYGDLIEKITPAGSTSTFAGGSSSGSADGAGTAATFNNPMGITADRSGNLYVADDYNGSIRKITPGGLVSTFVTGVPKPTGITIDAAGNLFVDEAGLDNIVKITTAGVVTTFAGSGTAGNQNNGPGSAASFDNPVGLVFDQSGNLYVTDSNNGLIRKITPSGIVTTIAGNGNGHYTSTNGVGANASFVTPQGIVIDQKGNLYVTDGGNYIRKIITTGYSITPALPPGLNFDSTTGIISGTPTSTALGTEYTITAYTANGATSSTTLLMAVH